MGNCCPRKTDEIQALNGGNDHRQHPTPPVFQGEGHRLGSAHDNNAANRVHSNNATNNNNKHDMPQPIIDTNLTDADRERIRADRAAAAEARLKKQGLPKPIKKEKIDPNAPLRGPNSKPTMTWNVG